MKIKHFIIVRFLCSPNLGFGEKIFDKNFIEKNVNITFKYLIQSLNNQTNKNFEVIYLLNEKHDINFINKLFYKKIKQIDNFNINFIKRYELKNYISNNIKGYDICITTRIDCDDLINCNAVADVQNLCIKQNFYPVILCGYNYGYRMYDDKRIYDAKYIYQNYRGFISIFISAITYLDKNNNNFINIYDLGPHHDCGNNLKELYNKLNISYKDCDIIHILDNKNDKSFVYNRYNSSSSSIIQNINEKTTEHSEYIHNINKQKFKDLFGFDLK